MKFQIPDSRFQIVVVGAGPAGASLAIRLAKQNFAVCLIEREKFPRHKLCGEFVSPECVRHFQDLGVLKSMRGAGGAEISKTVFYTTGGKSVSVPSKWFGGEEPNALGLSRAEMDFRILEKAKQSGAEILEQTQVVALLEENGKVCGVKVRAKDGGTKEISADLIVDATGRANVLAKLAAKSKSQTTDSKFTKSRIPHSAFRNRLVGFKTHLENAALEKGACEIYFFRGGYGGLSRVENGLANHCFLIRADVVREFGGDADKIVERVIFQNKRAFETMRDATPVFDWVAVSVDGFGAKDLNPAANLFAVGDAAAFIDPFTGSGMLMALESAEILSNVIAENWLVPAQIAPKYKILHRAKFQKRLRICALMRRAAFIPALTNFAVAALASSKKAREILARSTRQPIAAIDAKR